MKATAEIQITEGTSVDVVEGDLDNKVISRIYSQRGVKPTEKNLVRNHCVKNIVKHLYELRSSKDAKTSYQVTLILVYKIGFCKKMLMA